MIIMPQINLNSYPAVAPKKVLLYGKPGTGKTTASKYLPCKPSETYMLSFDNSFRYIPEWQNNGNIWIIDGNDPLHDLLNFTRWFIQGRNYQRYKSLVVDNITSYQDAWFGQAAKNSRDGLTVQIQYYNEFNILMKRFFATLTQLPLNILYTAWAEDKAFKDKNGNDSVRIQPSMRPTVRDFLEGSCDMVGYIRVMPDGKRAVYLSGTETLDAKNRLDNRKGCWIEDLFKTPQPQQPKPQGEHKMTQPESQSEKSAG